MLASLASLFLFLEGLFLVLLSSGRLLFATPILTAALKLQHSREVYRLLRGYISNDTVFTYTSWAVVHGDTQFGYAIFAGIVTIHAALKIKHYQRAIFYGSLVACHAIATAVLTRAIDFEYYTFLSLNAKMEFLTPARYLHAALFVCNFIFWIHALLAKDKSQEKIKQI